MSVLARLTSDPPLTSHPSAEPAAAEPVFDAEAMNQLTGMGFPEIRCKRALLATGNGGDANAAMEWLFQHMEDAGGSHRLSDVDARLTQYCADIDDPLPAAGVAAASSSNEPSEDQIAGVTEMGFSPAQARKALRETVRSVLLPLPVVPN